jgi:hypothetical protein
MSIRTVAIVFLALMCGLSAAYGILTRHAPAVTQAETVPVLVAAIDIPPLSVITADMVKTRRGRRGGSRGHGAPTGAECDSHPAAGDRAPCAVSAADRRQALREVCGPADDGACPGLTAARRLVYRGE